MFSLAFSLGCAFAPTTGALIGFRLLGMYFTTNVFLMLNQTFIQQLGYLGRLQLPLAAGLLAICSQNMIAL